MIKTNLQVKNVKTTFLLFLSAFLIFSDTQSYSQDCTVNAGGDMVVCQSDVTLVGAVSGSFVGNPTWTFISGPVVPEIESPNSLSTHVTGMIETGDYVFKISYPCTDGEAESTVTITARPRPVDFTAGPDIVNVCASVGEVILGGNIPSGYTGSWRAINIFSLERYSTTVSTNSSFSSITVSNPTFSLINKSNHNIDPAYYVILDIVSLDGICSYSDTAIVRFIPNPMINVPLATSMCISPEGGPVYPFFFYLNSSPEGPYFSTNYPGTSGTVAHGTTVTMTVNSQPIGGDIEFVDIENNIVHLDGLHVPGDYKFTLTIENACGSYTTPEITYTYSGLTPRRVSFQPLGHEAPEQLVIYSNVGSGGELHCDKVGSTDPISFYFNLHEDDPETLITVIEQIGVHPAGGDPTITLLGAGTRNREVVLTAPTGGWNVGTYKFNVYIDNLSGSCGRNQYYFVHISDGGRQDVHVDDIAVCYPGTGAISAVIELPSVYKQIVEPSYFQDFNGHYNIQVISKPVGSSTPTYTTTNLRSLTSETTVISNLDKVGEYYFRIYPSGYNSDVGPFLDQEYECSGSKMVDTFVIRVEGLVNSNAGSDQILGYTSSANLAGNDPGIGIGEWTLVSAPIGASPTIMDINDPFTIVTDLTEPGNYEFAWTISTPFGGCVSTDNVTITTLGPVLGINWISFDVRKENNNAILGWKVNIDKNVKGYYVEKSHDANNWFEIGYLNADHSQKINEIEFIDKELLSSTIYYRIKLVNFDETYTYSEVRVLKDLYTNVINVYPNPTTGLISIKDIGKNAETLIIINSLGQIVKTIDIVNQSDVKVDMKELNNGVYSIMIYNNDGTSNVKTVMKL